MNLKPQTKIVLNHIRRAGSITSVEAESVWRVRHLPARIFELRNAGYPIVKEMRRDLTGQAFAHYTMEA